MTPLEELARIESVIDSTHVADSLTIGRDTVKRLVADSRELHASTNLELRKVLGAAREVVRRLYHKHADRDGKPFGPGGCFSSMYETCGEHHAHDMNCGGYPRWCRKAESDYVVNELYAALVELDTAPGPT